MTNSPSHRRRLALAVLVLALLSGCGLDSERNINCNDLLPASQAAYSTLASIVTDQSDPRSCAPCHNGSSPSGDLNLGTPPAAYFTLRDRMDHIYPQIYSGQMPRDGQSWNEDELQLLRSWYCRGAFDD